MTSPDSPIAGLTRVLATRGFAYKGRGTSNLLSFSGSITAEGQTYPVILAVHPEGREPPVVVLEDVPDKLKPVTPHISSSGHLCYAAARSIVLDVFDLAGQTLACVDRAADVLGSLLRGEMVKDLEEEFFAYWNGDYCFIDLRQSSNDSLECVVAKRKGGQPAVFVMNDRSRALEKAKALGAQPDDGMQVTVRRIKTQVQPRPLLGDWPPQTVSDVLKWQGILDAPCRRKLDEHITEVFKSGEPWMLCVIESPKMPYAFFVDFRDHVSVQGRQRVEQARALAYRAPIFPVQCVRIDDEYIAQRNSPGQATFVNRRIGVIGCGTIGGFLAELLVKAGAGSDGGELALVDNDILLPQNIGRHRLGFNSVLKNKARALADELQRSMPGTNIHALPVDAMQANLAGFDILVNATGEESLGHLLTAKLSGASFVPILSVWIEGPGIAVRALLRDVPSAACTRCMNAVDRRMLYPVVEGEVPTLLAGHGCESLYVPFTASASIQAACLAADILTSWAGGVATPRLRTRILDQRLRKGAEDQDPAPLTGCPACTT